jgi:hypothetical protein
MSTREELRAATKEYQAAAEALHRIIGVGEELVTGRTPTPVVITDSFAEWDAAEARLEAAWRAWRAAMQQYTPER